MGGFASLYAALGGSGKVMEVASDMWNIQNKELKKRKSLLENHRRQRDDYLNSATK